MHEWIIVKFSVYVGHDINDLEHLGDDAFNPLGAGFNFYIAAILAN